MGELFIHDLQPYIDKYGCNVFVETGTGIGTGLKHAIVFPFARLYSIEINKELCRQARERFDVVGLLVPNILKIINADSITGLIASLRYEMAMDESQRKILYTPHGGPILSCCLFWLDAHFPGADFQLGSYDDEHIDEIKYPLLYELKTIFRLRPDNKDVFIMDDLQLYEDGDYEIKMAPDFLAKHRRPIQPILDIVSKTHNIKRDYRHQGFLIAEPK